jgi:hypothetical protein
MPPDNTASYPFYWVDADTTARQVSYSYTMSNGRSNSASAYFKVSGPVGTGGQSGADFFTATLGAVGVYPPGVASSGLTRYPMLEFGTYANPGITFNLKANAPASVPGAFQWVQLIAGSFEIREVTNPPSSSYTLCGGPCPGLYLDSVYPYPTLQPPNTIDDPGVGIGLAALLPGTNITAMGEVAERFSATMYLMWDPALPGLGQATCAPASTIVANGRYASAASTCTGSIPVPLGFMNWGFYGDAINTLMPQPAPNTTTWVLNNCSGPNPAQPAFQSSKPKTDPYSGFPFWTGNANMLE